MSEPHPRSPAPQLIEPPLSQLPRAPAVTVVVIGLASAFLLVHMLRLPGSGADNLGGVELFLDLVVVLLGLMSVALALHTLDPEPDRQAHLLVGALAVAAVGNFLHAMLLQASVGAALAPGQQDASAFYGLSARLVESLAWLMYAFGLRMRGPCTAWAAGAALLSVGLAWLGAGGLPVRLALASEPFHGVALGWLGTVGLGLAALVLWRRPAPANGGQSRWLAGSAALLALAGVVARWPTGWPWVADLASHGLRVTAYALLFQAMYVSGIRRPFLRAREVEAQLRDSEVRLHLLGRNLPDSVTYQLMRDHDGSRRFIYMGEAVERLVGVRVEDALRDPALLYDRILPADRTLNDRVEEQSFASMGVSDNVVRVVRTDGEVRWIRMSSSPRALPDGRVIWDGVATDVTEQRENELLARRRGAQLDGLLRNLPGGVARIGADLRLLYVNPLQAQWLHTDVGALEGQLLSDVLPPVVLAQAMPHLQKALSGHIAVFENRIDYADGPQFRHTTFAPEFGPDGGVVAVVSFAYDLTAQRRMAYELDQQRSRLAVLVNSIPDMVSLKDAEGRYLLANPAFERWVGRPEGEILGKTDEAVWPAAEAQRMRELDARAMASGHPLAFEEELTLADGGSTCCFETIKTPIRDAQGHVTGLLGVCRDITDRKRAEQEIERLAFYDALTSLPNRRLLLDRLQRATAASQRHGRPGALLFIDLDNFKDLNDTLGHDMGDRLLAQVAHRLVGCVGATDTVARFGGDEFVVMLEDLDLSTINAAAQAERVADKLLACLNEPFELGAQQHFSTPSIGITLFGDQPCSVDELLKRADLAMYQAKAAGRNTQRFFDPHMQAQANARSHLEADLRQGLARGELRVHYQPIVDGRTRISGAEALVRWPHPERGMISPMDFIPLAEQTGLILPLGRFVLKSACEQLVRWSQREDTRHLTVSVNVSARQFRQPGFVGEVLDVLRDTGAEPRRLKLELTESMLLGDIEDTIGRMSQLKSGGVGFSLDDFGTGYSSLSYLKRLPLDQVKIDQGFVRDVLTDPNDAAIVRTILALADSLDLNVVAEGVETTGQLSFLKLHGCNGFQGYLFGRPGPAEALEAALGSPT